jgi:hypothetical protein
LDELAVDHAVEPMTLTAAIPSRRPPTPPVSETSSAWDHSSRRKRQSHLEALFGGPRLSGQKHNGADGVRHDHALRTLAERFIVDGLGGQAFLSSSDEEIEAKLTAIPGIGPWTARG